MSEEPAFFAVIGQRGSLGRAVPTNVGPYLVAYRILRGDVVHWGNRVINFGVSPDAAKVTQLDEQIPLPVGASHLSFEGLTDLAAISRHGGKLSVRFRTVSGGSDQETHVFKVGARKLTTRADIDALQFELSLYTAFTGITIIDISIVAP